MARKILMVSSYPPMACGIGTYAAQSVARLRKEGNIVDVLSLPGGDGDFIEDLQGSANLKKLLEYSPAYDEIFIQYCPYFFFMSYDLPGGRKENLKTCLTMNRVFKKCGNVKVLCHEERYATADQLGRLMAWAERIKWNGVSQLIFHTRKELERFSAAYGWATNDPRLALKEHHSDFQKNVEMTRAEARKACGWPQDKTIFLSIGFVQPSKGFDRALRAFASIPHEQAQLYVIGSSRYDTQEMKDYLALLDRLAAETEGASVEIGYVSDDRFDACIIASDFVVLPYREIWSSSVLARAKLFQRPVIATNVGGLAEQLQPGDLLVNDDAELAEAMRRSCDDRIQVIPLNGVVEIRRAGQSVRIPKDDVEEVLESLQVVLK